MSRLKLRRALKARGLTQRELAERARVSESMISRVADGSRVPSLPVSLRIARVLRVPVEVLGTRR